MVGIGFRVDEGVSERRERSFGKDCAVFANAFGVVGVAPTAAPLR
jgi:hypothetical protein